MRRVLLAETHLVEPRGCDALALTLWDMAQTLQQTLNLEDSLDRENQSVVMMMMIEPLGSIL